MILPRRLAIDTKRRLSELIFKFLRNFSSLVFSGNFNSSY